VTLQSDLLTSLTSDSALMALLTGGVYTDTRISRTNTPAAFDTNAEIKPCALLKLGVETPVPPYVRGTRLFIEVYLYQYLGYTTIKTARDRLYDLWHEKKVGTATWQILCTDAGGDAEDEALGCSLIVSRYVAMRKR